MTDLRALLLQFGSDQRRLLGGWRDLLDDIRDLCRNLNALPDQCACGDGDAHLSGTCVCCSSSSRGRIANCADCRMQVAQLRPRVVTLTADAMRFFPVVRILLQQSPPGAPARREGANVERHIASVIRTFDRLVIKAGEFQDGCRASHLRVLKDTANTLLNESNLLGNLLETIP